MTNGLLIDKTGSKIFKQTGANEYAVSKGMVSGIFTKYTEAENFYRVCL